MISVFGIVGTGVIGAGWAVRALSRGWDVVAHDPAPGAEDRLKEVIGRAWPSVSKLGLYSGADPGRVTFVGTTEEVGERAGFVQESAPEVIALKKQVLQAIDAAASPEVVIASSTSGLLPSHLQEGLRHPERLVVGHPFNPVYLLPLVEVVGGEQTAGSSIAFAEEVYSDLDMHPLHVRHEIDGFLSDRLLEAVWREILHIVAEGVATTGELDRAIVFGPGLRWAGMGTNLIYHLAGGEEGMSHMLAQFGPALEWPWSKLVAPSLTTELIERMVEGTREQAQGRSIAELERLRDSYLISVMNALRTTGIGAGEVLNRREARIHEQVVPAPWTPETTIPAPLPTYATSVSPEWVDYNQHMTESAFLFIFGWASDALFRYIGIDETYRDGGHSVYTVESHLVYRREASIGDPLRVSTQLLGHDDKRLHIFHVMTHGLSGEVLCTNEQMLVHVDTTARKSSPMLPGPRIVLDRIWQVHSTLARVPASVMKVPGR